MPLLGTTLGHGRAIFHIMLILIIVLLILFGGVGTFHTWNNYGPAYGGGFSVGTILLILLVIYLLGGLRQ